MSTSEPLDTSSLYQTAPLHDPKTQIRLLRATQLEERYLSYNFIVCDLDDAPPYDAVSYTWGDPSERGFIRVNNVPINVTENCRYALWQVRQLGSIYIWIDAVCIDQQNSEEKGAQVAFMFYIYKSATQVLACIGPPDEVSERVRAALDEYSVQAHSYPEEKNANSWLMRKGDTFCEALWEETPNNFRQGHISAGCGLPKSYTLEDPALVSCLAPHELHGTL